MAASTTGRNTIMALTPIDIENKQFHKRLLGFDVDEVNEFMKLLIHDYEALLRKYADSQTELSLHVEKLQHFASIEDTLSKTIILAQETADDLKQNARKEAQLIVKEAEKNANRIINEALSAARQAALETEELKKQAAIYRTRLKSLIEAQLELLSHEDWSVLETNGVLSVDLERR
jgi:cell division initiation protein